MAERLGRSEGYRLIVVFGSAAREEAVPGDLDLGIKGDSSLDMLAATNTWVAALGFQHVDLCDLRRADPLVAMVVAQSGVPLYEASPGEFDRFVSLAVRRYGDTEKLREQQRLQMLERVERIRSGT
ncbi:MAG: nucleotidyltransferase domain-containing protein [Gemmatimonadetes bacterium]|nr:nucleotidyltransferase domain-containing protein [Gemmatimonadota bacterium]